MPSARPSRRTHWSKGKAIYAAGVQFPPVHYNGQTFLPGQANNFYIFPAVGMAIFATQAKRVTDEMFIEAAQAVADQVPPELLKQGLLYPLQSNILETEIQTAARVAKLVFDSGLARVDRPADMVAFIRQHVYKPEYGSSCEALRNRWPGSGQGMVPLRGPSPPSTWSEQNVYRALSIADRAYVFEAGRLILADTGRALTENERIKAAYLGL